MRAPPTYLGPAGIELAKRRLAAYLRYAALVAEQEAALEKGDLEHFGTLAQVIDSLQSEIDMPRTQLDPLVSGSPEADAETVDAEAVHVLRDTIERSERIERKLATMKRTQAGKIRQVTQRTLRARGYRLESPSSNAASPKLDVRS